MEQLSDFKPLKRVELPGLESLDCSGLILVVGPNSSGKSQFLHDLHLRLRGEPRELVVAAAVEVGKPDQLEQFLQGLQKEGYFTRISDGSDNDQLRPQKPFLGTGEAASPININQAKQWFESYVPGGAGTIRGRVEFLAYFGRLLVTALFLDRRLTAVNQTNMFDFETALPQNDLQALYIDDDAKAKLLSEVQATFAKAVWPDPSRGNILCVRVSDGAASPSAEQRLSPRTMSQYRTIETEGDGLKSYVVTCIALLLGRRPVCLIDEPELCLHPPQAYSLGRFIGRFGSTEERATFVATHSSHVLRGVIQTAEKLQIVRLTRRGRSFEAHQVPPDTLTEILKRPSVRAETVLDGIFAQGVAVVEADGDRAVYQAVHETLSEEFRIDVHFTAVGGTGGIADTCRLYRTLRIPIAVIADLDLISDTDRLRQIVTALADEDTADSLIGRAKDVAAAIKALPPTIDGDETRALLNAAASARMDWSTNDDSRLCAVLRDLVQRLDRMKRIKRGIRGLPPAVAGSAEALVAELAKIGLFVVPVGELEEWLAAEGISASKQKKWAWATEAAAKVRQLGAKQGDIWKFMRGVANYLSKEEVSPAI